MVHLVVAGFRMAGKAGLSRRLRNSVSRIPMADDVREQTSRNSDRLANWVAEHRLQVVSMGVGLASFLATEFMHHLFVPDMGYRWERLLAEGVSAVVVAVLTAQLMQTSNQLREATLLRMSDLRKRRSH